MKRWDEKKRQERLKALRSSQLPDTAPEDVGLAIEAHFRLPDVRLRMAEKEKQELAAIYGKAMQIAAQATTLQAKNAIWFSPLARQPAPQEFAALERAFVKVLRWKSERVMFMPNWKLEEIHRLMLRKVSLPDPRFVKWRKLYAAYVSARFKS